MHILDGTLKITGVSLVSGDNNLTIAYPNTESGRAQLALECPSEIINEVLSVWGDAPMPEPEHLVDDEGNVVTLESRVTDLETEVDALVTGLEGIV